MSKFQDIVGLALTHWFPDELILENHHPEWLDGMELDFHILNLSLAVEVDGSQHRDWAPGLQRSKAAFIAQVHRDRLKRRICRENGVLLTRMHKYGEDNLRRFGRFLWSRIGMDCPPLPPEIESQWADHCKILQKFCETDGAERRSFVLSSTGRCL